MFDDKPTQPAPGSAPANLPVEPASPDASQGGPDDMFASLDDSKGPGAAPAETIEKMPDALSSGLLKRKEGPAASTPAALPAETGAPAVTMSYPTRGPLIGKILLFVGIAVLLGGLGFAGWWGYMKFIKKGTVVVVEEEMPPAEETPPPAAVAPPLAPPSEEAVFGEQVDLDADGLSAAQEQEAGTNPDNPDSDGDGLTDGDEFNVLKTAPLVADSDGDGLTDGDEVKVWRTDPLKSDTDGDGFPDGTEVRNGYDPKGPGKLPK